MKTKICAKCANPQPVSNFTIDKSRKDGRCRLCKECAGKQSKLYYEGHRKECLARSYKDKRNRRVDRQTQMAEYLLLHPCIDCGETDIIVLDFDHKDPSEKLNSVSKLADLGYSRKVVKKEIAKCSVRCSNCHKRRTAKQQGWLRAKIANKHAGDPPGGGTYLNTSR